MFRLLKRLVLLLFVLVAIGTAAFYLLYFRRTSLPPAPSHGRAVPAIARLPGLSACWIETGKTFSRFSIGIVIAAGMTIGTIFTLFVTPAVYTYVAREHRAHAAASAPVAERSPG